MIVDGSFVADLMRHEQPACVIKLLVGEISGRMTLSDHEVESLIYFAGMRLAGIESDLKLDDAIEKLKKVCIDAKCIDTRGKKLLH